MGKGKKPHGHYCRVCGEYKANEKFSGKGHAAHICKACSALPADERSELLMLGKIEGMVGRHLSEAEVKWLRGKLKDERPDVRHAAKAVHDLRFPHYERNIAKKGLTLRSLEFFIKSDVWDEYGSMTSAHMRFFADESGKEKRRSGCPARAGRSEVKSATTRQGHNLIHFAAQKNHLGIYPGEKAMEHFGPRLTEYKTSKGAVQFPYKSFGAEQMALITEIALWCGKENAKI